MIFSFVSNMRFLRVLALALGVCTSAQALAQQARIGFIDTQRVFRESGAARAADLKIVEDFSGREKEMQELNERLKSLSESLDRDVHVLGEEERTKRMREITNLNRDLQRKQREFREDLNQRRNQEHAMFSDYASGAIKKISEAEGYDLIIDNPAWFNPHLDITDKVIKALEK